eukprot:g16114.t1
MGNRGKGHSKGKGGKGKKGKKGGGGASKWGDENTAAVREEQGQPVKKKRRMTQEAQDRQRRVKLMELRRAKEREHRERLSRPNQEPIETAAAVAKPKRRKRKKRPRGDRDKDKPRRPDGREILYYTSSDDDIAIRGSSGGRGRGEEQEEEEEAGGGFDAGLASYKKLLSALESSSSRGSGGSGEDKDLAAAMVARRMQREGRDGDDSDSGSGGDAEGEIEADEGSDSDSDGDEDSDGIDGGDGVQQAEGVPCDGEGEDCDEEHQHQQEGNGSMKNKALNGTTARGKDLDDVADADSGLSADEDEVTGGSGRQRGKMTDGRSIDDFWRHFVSTPVFPPEKAAELLSPRGGRPSFKPLPSSSSARGKWESVGLSASVSRTSAKDGDDDILPAPMPKGASVSTDLGVLPSLAEGWDASNADAAAARGGTTSVSKLQSLLLPALTGYRDMLYCGWRDEDAEEIRRSYTLHALNHALTSQRRVVRHTARLRKAAEEARVAEALARSEKKAAGAGTASSDDADKTEAAVAAATSNGGAAVVRKQQPRRRNAGANGAATPSSSPAAPAQDPAGPGAGKEKEKDKPTAVELDSDEWQRDQGFTRPKVLILLPFRGVAHEVVETMIGLLGPKTVVVNKARFDEEYGPDNDPEGGDIEGAEPDGTKRGEVRAERARAVLERKPADWKALLGEGRNVDDMFTLGIALSPGGGKGKPGEGKGVGMRLYCDFYNSDIIIASPVALHRAAVPGEGDGGDGEGGSSGVDSDFLSSVEVCILDRADVFLMQNWAYVPDIAEALNSRPTGERAARADFSRVRPLFLHEQARLFRQTLVFSAFQDPNLNALASRHLRNHDGVIKVSRPSGDGYICGVALQAKQVFQRVPCDSLATQDDSRFDYFVGTVLPQVLRSKQTHTAIFIPSYFDYVRIRNHLMKNKTSVVNVHEYSRGSEVARSRARFFRGDRDLLLYTGRAHFFNRYCIRGIHHLIFYSLPECPQFYPEMVNLLEEAESVAAVTCLSLFTRFERLSLERIVGEDRAGHMLASPKNTFLFC